MNARTPDTHSIAVTFSVNAASREEACQLLQNTLIDEFGAVTQEPLPLGALAMILPGEDATEVIAAWQIRDVRR